LAGTFIGAGAPAARCFAGAVAKAVDFADDPEDFAAVFTGFFAAVWPTAGVFADGAAVFFAGTAMGFFAAGAGVAFLRTRAAGAAAFSFADCSRPEVALAIGVVLVIRLS
jgi:hypothetical protein